MIRCLWSKTMKRCCYYKQTIQAATTSTNPRNCKDTKYDASGSFTEECSSEGSFLETSVIKRKSNHVTRTNKDIESKMTNKMKMDSKSILCNNCNNNQLKQGCAQTISFGNKTE